MKNTRKALAISITICLGLAILFLVYSRYLEYQARQQLPPGMKTPEAIQYYYDGSVCLSCDIAGMALFILFTAIAAIIAIVWGIYEYFSTKRQFR